MSTTERQQAVWMQVEAIPAGKVASYGQVARLAGYPGLARQIGRLLGQHPDHNALPWHRVLRADGSIAFPAGSRSFDTQVQRLRDEGVPVRQGRVDRRYWWDA